MKARTQFIRYVVVGLVSNAVIYLVYILLTRLGMGPKLAMSLLYAMGVLQTFVFNRKWSFQFGGAATPALVRYALLYAAGYAIQFLALMLLVDYAGLPHQWVMGALVLTMAVFLFVGQKVWVFKDKSNLSPQFHRSDRN